MVDRGGLDWIRQARMVRGPQARSRRRLHRRRHLLGGCLPLADGQRDRSGRSEDGQPGAQGHRCRRLGPGHVHVRERRDRHARSRLDHQCPAGDGSLAQAEQRRPSGDRRDTRGNHRPVVPLTRPRGPRGRRGRTGCSSGSRTGSSRPAYPFLSRSSSTPSRRIDRRRLPSATRDAPSWPRWPPTTRRAKGVRFSCRPRRRGECQYGL